MKTIIEQAKYRLQDVRLSHVPVMKIKEGWQQDMWECQISNYDGYGPVIKVYGATPAIAEAIATLVLDSLNGKRIDQL